MKTIFGNSIDPVEIKVIPIHLWSLSEEVRAVLKYRQSICKKKGIEFKYHDIISEYKGQIPEDYILALENNMQINDSTPLDSNESSSINDTVVDASELDDSEDAMAALLGGGTEEVKDADQLDDSEDAMAALLGGGSDNEDTSPQSFDTPQSSGGNKSIKIIPPIRSQKHLISDEKVSGGILLLSDINMDQIRFFCHKEFVIGQTIMIEFILHGPLVLSAEIIHTNRFNISSRIIREEDKNDPQCKYRVIANFKFIKKGERHFLRDFIASIEPDKVKTKAKKPKEDDIDDDLAGLSDFF